MDIEDGYYFSNDPFEILPEKKKANTFCDISIQNIFNSYSEFYPPNYRYLQNVRSEDGFFFQLCVRPLNVYVKTFFPMHIKLFPTSCLMPLKWNVRRISGRPQTVFRYFCVRHFSFKNFFLPFLFIIHAVRFYIKDTNVYSFWTTNICTG